jgi:predicted esterase
VPGFPLRPSTLYALLLTDAVLDARGEPLRASQRFRDLLQGIDQDVEAELFDAYAPLADFALAEGIELDGLVGGTVFRTSDPTAQMRAIARHVREQPTPALGSIGLHAGTLPAAESGNYHALAGTYRAPIYQQGETPYGSRGGDIHFDAAGAPLIAGEMDLRFALSVPQGAMPEGGWPVALYHHGTGGDAFSFMDNGTAFHLAAVGVAAIGIDAPVHGTRRPDGVDPTLLFFNINNPRALRDNVRQGAADLLYLKRVVEGFALDAAASPTAEAIRFDPDKVFMMGHSQGGLTGPLMLAVADNVKGAMLSGAGGSITMTILFKTEPIDIPASARGLLGLPDDEPLDAFHPFLALVQAFTEVADPVNYVPYYYRWPGGSGFDLWLTQGLLDLEVPPIVTGALATAAGVSPVDPIALRIEGFGLRGLSALQTPVASNVAAQDGADHTAVYSQYPNEGHFLIFDNAGAQAQLRHWFATLASGGPAELATP